jgi:putative colanic acid biosynthesis acetyltransferase WcaF
MVLVAQNRQRREWSRRELVGRVLWGLVWPLFRFSPRVFWNWRCLLLRMFGAKVGRHVHIHPSVTVFIPWNLTIGDWSSVGFDALLYNLGPLRIGERVTVSQRAHLCGGTHDHRDPSMPLVKSPIVLGDDVWVCADALVGPGVTVGHRAIVAAGAVVVRDVPDQWIVGGNPAARIGNQPD